ncbi:MAG: hypothetical protein HKO94_06385 [Flavobacteriaceae bacterium]|nr:hypothetical protein [Flavobacteriaceae bacterium]
MRTKVNLKSNLLKVDFFIAFLLVLMPIMFYGYLLVPETDIWETKYFVISANHYPDVQTFIWALGIKLLMLGFLIIWFLTGRHWWKYCLLIPIIIELHKLFGAINDNVGIFDEMEFFTSLPFTIPVVLFLIFLSKKTKYYSLTQIVNSDVEEEINKTIEQIFKSNSKKFKQIKERFTDLKRNKISMDKDDYLRELVHLRNELLTE